MSEELAGQIPEDYLTMVMKCPFEAGRAAGAMALGDFLQTDRGRASVPIILENIEKADKIFATGKFTADEAIDYAFGGALETDENGAIVRQVDRPETPA